MFALAALALFFLYLFGLTRTGMLSADEPRYAAIGQAMAASGDWVTPRLWGQAWFEKPALLYWMTAVGFQLHLDVDMAPRLPVALASILFLIFYWVYVRREFGECVASYATVFLGTSVGWLAFSRVAVTDLPLAVCFGSAMLLVMGNPSGWGSTIVAGALLGLAILAKGLVPLVLFLPAIWYLWRQPWRLAAILGTAIAVAAPWYVLVTLRNGTPFLEEFFVKHHFGRFTSGALQHERPFWFYVPVLLAAIFPWTPLLGGLFRRSVYANRREKFLLAWLVFGFVFFSASRNKLPGYLLPLLPALAILLALGLSEMRDARRVLAISGALLGVIPAITGALPQALAEGASRAPLTWNWGYLLGGLGFAVLVWWLPRDWAAGLIAATMTLIVASVVWRTYPVLDKEVSARYYWRSHLNEGVTCSNNPSRSWRFGLNYYSGKIVSNCNQQP